MLLTTSIFLKQLLQTCTFILAMLVACKHDNPVTQKNSSKSYFISISGDDANDGNKTHPWKTINRLNNVQLLPGDTVYFEAGQTFSGSLMIDAQDAGKDQQPVVITSYGNGKAIIDGGSNTALTVYNTSYIQIKQISFAGAGRKTGNTKDGVIINNCNHISIDSIDVKGFQKSGLLINTSANVNVRNVYATENGFSGIYAIGEWNKRNCSNINILYCKTDNNPGDPTNLTNHSGNGILAGYCKNVLIDHCSATNNGWDMPRKGNGPVGIWCFEADSVTIQYCIAYKNKTAPGAADGGGFDLDGGVTNSVIQYCLSYENEGSGYGLFQYAGAATWNNNTVRYCISENDGSVSPAHAGVFIWNSSGDTAQLANCYFYNNTIYNAKGAAISYEAVSANKGFRFYNNIFVGRDSLVLGKESNSIYLGNNWYSINGGFFAEGFTNLQSWANAKSKESLNGKLVGLNINPMFANEGNAGITNASQISSFNNYALPTNSALQNGGLNLQQLFGVNNGGKSFNGNAAPMQGVGACF
ncbi:MAG: right-handed parallel beta-helix repeat-containing protein [Chitinophagaceae bacterium]